MRSTPPEDDWREAVYRRAMGDEGNDEPPRKGPFNGEGHEEQGSALELLREAREVA